MDGESSVEMVSAKQNQSICAACDGIFFHKHSQSAGNAGSLYWTNM
jgi:hypothetical protein